MKRTLPLAFGLLACACSDSSSSGGGGQGAASEGAGGAAGGAPASGGGDEGGGGAAPAGPTFLAPRTGLSAEEMGVLVNDDDPLSVSIADYYVAARGIPTANVVHLHVPNVGGNSISGADFAPLASAVDDALAGTTVEALAITWTQPYAVGNMSVTSAFAMGYRDIGDTCTDPSSQYASPNPYATSPDSTRPFTDLAFRPAMTIAAATFDEAKALIDRGVAADDTWPMGAAYLMNTSDQTRSARCILNATYGWTNECQILLDHWDAAASGIQAGIVAADAVTDKPDVMFYVQGLSSVPNLATNTYLPGAVGDHLTSFGGQIPTSGQMSAIEFLRAGTTGSFGTVVEPCAYQQKFPDPSVLIPRYFAGATLLEAYWKSVAWPAEGIFIGEPLARPFGDGFRTHMDGDALVIETTALLPGHTYALEAADVEDGPWDAVQAGITSDKPARTTLTVPSATRQFYRLSE